MASRKTLILIAIAVILPVIVLALWTIFGWMLLFLSPCVHWGVGHQALLQITSKSTCSAVSETSFDVFMTMLAVQGGMISSCIVGFLGVFYFNRLLIVAGSVALFAESFLFIFDGLFILILPCAVFLAVSVLRTPRVHEVI